MTELAYLKDPAAAYVREFSARIVARPPGGVVLDRTYFYPEGGGQPSDRGELGTPGGPQLRVVEVIRSGSEVIHRLDRRGSKTAELRVGAGIVASVDWPRRYSHMRAHTTQHLLSARLFAGSGRRTRSARLSTGGGVLELEGVGAAIPEPGEITRELRAWANRGLPVGVRFLPRGEFERDPGPRSGLIPLPAHVDPVRVIEIVPADRCPCGGTHLKNTAEIGTVAVRLSGGARVEFILGAGAEPPTPPE
ncbi:MAG: alanyl-tRNA editing protein [Thermoplasmata archaeon]